MDSNSKLKKNKNSQTQEHQKTVDWPRSTEPLLDPSSDSFLFTVHLRRAAHPYPLKPFSRAVAGLNLQQPTVKALITALNEFSEVRLLHNLLVELLLIAILHSLRRT
jgi:hypothetical protein